MDALTLAGVVTVTTTAYVGRERWRVQARRDRHARLAIARMSHRAYGALLDLADRNRRLAEETAARRDPAGKASLFGPDPISDFHRQVMAELRTWTDDITAELNSVRGRRLTTRRRTLRNLLREIAEVCSEIEAREGVAAMAGMRRS